MQFPLRGVVVSAEGALTDVRQARACAWQEALREAGYEVPLARICREIGLAPEDTLQDLIGHPDERIRCRYEQIFETEYLEEILPFRCSGDLLSRMKSENLKLIGATCENPAETRFLLEKVGGEGSSLELVSSSRKTVETCVSKLNLYPAEALMIGCSPHDVHEAIDAGLRIIALRCGGWSDQDLEGASAIYDHPQDLLENFESSLLGTAYLRTA